MVERIYGPKQATSCPPTLLEKGKGKSFPLPPSGITLYISYSKHALAKHATPKNKCDSAIGQHLLENPECAKIYNDDKFRIIGQARSSFHLGVLESVYIKTQNPSVV